VWEGQVETDTFDTMRFNQFAFPGWRVLLDGREITPHIDDVGLQLVDVTPGQHTLKLQFANTPVRTVTNIMSLVSFIGWLVVTVLGKSRLQDRKLLI
jgi:hypothetical protein